MEYHDWEEGCPLLLTQRMIMGKWKLSIIWFLATYEIMRFTQLQKAFDDAKLTQKMLTQHLKQLQEDHLVERKVYNEVPLKVEYSLTNLGKSFIPVMTSMEAWGEYYISECKQEDESTSHQQ